MNAPDRLIPSWPFPSYVFIPGENPHPKKTGGHMEGLGDPVSPAIDLSAPEKSDHLRYAIDLFNYGYFWESHVYFEALWNAHARSGPVADLLKALIKLGASGVKANLGQSQASEGHRERAIELLQSVKEVTGETYLGFDLDHLIREIRSANQIKILPLWK